MNDLVTGILVMKLDVYRQSDFQDPNTGALKKQWNYVETIPCHAKGVISNSGTSRGGDREIFDNKYSYNQFLQVRTGKKLSLRDKVTNVSNSDGDVIWEEANYPTNTPTVFEVTGTTPILDPFGNIMGYNASVKRSENQQIGL